MLLAISLHVSHACMPLSCMPGYSPAGLWLLVLTDLAAPDSGCTTWGSGKKPSRLSCPCTHMYVQNGGIQAHCYWFWELVGGCTANCSVSRPSWCVLALAREKVTLVLLQVTRISQLCRGLRECNHVHAAIKAATMPLVLMSVDQHDLYHQQSRSQQGCCDEPWTPVSS